MSEELGAGSWELGGGRPQTADRRAGDLVSGRLAELARAMRARGSRAGVAELLGAHRALAAVDPSDAAQSRLALRAVLCSERDDLERFEAAFASCFGAQRPEPPPIDPIATVLLPRVAVPAPGSVALDLDEPGEIRPSAWSELELLGGKDFAAYTDAERALARTLIARLARRGPTRRGRRMRGGRRRGSRLDARGTLRASLRHAGEPLERRFSEPRSRPRRLVLVCDVSGSMDPYARMLLTYAHACVEAHGRCEAFAFSTRLTRITRELRGRDHDAALRRAAGSASDWAGGTRIGDALAELNRVHGRRVGRGAIVVILSDGWDRGDPELLLREIARLGRCAHRLVWLNPLKAHPAYEPLTRGMAAALPHVDAFLAGNSLDSLARLATLLESGFEPREPRLPVGRRQMVR